MSSGMRYEPRLHVVLFQPEIPPNTGNIGRTCVALGAKLWLVEPLGFEISEKQLRRAGLDYWQHLEWEAVKNWQALTTRLQGPFSQGRAWFFTKTAKRFYTDAKYARGDVLVFGSESSGLPAELLQANQATALRLPMRPQVRSLNLSATAAVAMYEAIRQMGDFREED